MNFGSAPTPMGAPTPMSAPAPMSAPDPMSAPAAGVVSLAKGQRVSLSKLAPSLKKVMIGLGWDTNKYDGGYDFDLDASAFLCDANGKCDPRNFVFYNNPDDMSGSVHHMGDNRTGEGEGDDEQILVDLDKVPTSIQKIAITVTIFESKQRKQTFGNVSNAFIRLVDDTTGKEMLRYDLGEDFSTQTALVFAELYRHNGEWKFNAVGEGYGDDTRDNCSGLATLCRSFGIDAED